MIRTAQIQDIPTVVQLIHASIRSCILDHQRRESEIYEAEAKEVGSNG